jgi:hypothetical protein
MNKILKKYGKAKYGQTRLFKVKWDTVFDNSFAGRFCAALQMPISLLFGADKHFSGSSQHGEDFAMFEEISRNEFRQEIITEIRG